MASARSNKPDRTVAGRVPPHSEEAERGLLGAILLNAERILDLCVERGLKPEAFYLPAHRLIFEAILDLARDNRPVDALTVTDTLKSRGALERTGGPLYLDALLEGTPTAAHAEYYLDIVLQKQLLRTIIDRARRAEAACYDPSLDAASVLSRVEQSFFDIGENPTRGTAISTREAVMSVMTQVDTFLSTHDGIYGLATGFRNLDEVLHGLRGGNMIVLAARPSMGKTSLAMNIAYNVAMGYGKSDHRPRPVGIFSLEMSRDDLVLRLLCTRARVSMAMVTGGLIARYGPEHNRLIEASKELSQAPIFIDDSAGLDINELRARARRLRKKHGVELIVVDYLQLLHADVAADQGRQIEISTVSAGLKAMAKELNIPVLCLSQLSRATETRDKFGIPRLSDLRDSGSIEQDADVVLLLRRPCKYPGDPEHGDLLLAIVDVAKHRNGPTKDRVPFNFEEQFTLFLDRDERFETAPSEATARAAEGGEEGGQS